MTQTAVEWLEKEFNKLEATVGVYGIMYSLIDQAKAMEKEQIMDAFQEGKWDWHAKLNDGKESKDPAFYYNETYGKSNRS
jgi:hypothetical protein